MTIKKRGPKIYITPSIEDTMIRLMMDQALDQNQFAKTNLNDILVSLRQILENVDTLTNAQIQCMIDGVVEVARRTVS